MGRPKFGVVKEERLRVKCNYKRAIFESRRKFETCRTQKLAYKLAELAEEFGLSFNVKKISVLLWGKKLGLVVCLICVLVANQWRR